MSTELFRNRFVQGQGREQGRGGGVGQGQGRGRRAGTTPGSGPGDNCTCPTCGHKLPHQAGSRFKDLTCQ